MDYNLQVALTYFILFTAFVICTILLFWKWKARNVKPFIYAAFSWGSFAMMNLLLGVARFIVSYTFWIIYNLGYVFTVIAVLFFVLFIDNVTRESINVVAISIVCTIGGLLIYTNVFSGYILPEIPFREFYDLLMDFYLIFLFIFLIRSTLKAPKHLKSLSIFLTLTTVVLGLLSFVGSWIFLGYGFFLSGIYASIMNLVLVFVLVRNPELLYILPYRVQRLTVIHRKINISIFDHQFAKSEIDQDLLAGLLSALEAVSVEVMHHGELEEIKLSEGFLIFVKSENITVGLITSNSSKHLRDSLKKFTKEFEARFKNELVQYAPDLSQFESATEILDFFFGNIPSYT